MSIETQRDHEQKSKLRLMTVQALEDHDVKVAKEPTELRQFACLPCNRKWWRTVLKTKKVSRCIGGVCSNQRYEALPREKEFGIGRFLCPNCEREFYGYCEAMDKKKCRKCGTNASPPHIHPKWIKRVRKRRQQQRKLNPNAEIFTHAPPTRALGAGPQFYPVSEFDDDLSSFEALNVSSPPPPYEAQPTLPKRRTIFNPSLPHLSTGSTISTFLSQCEFEKNGEEVDLDYDEEVDEAAVGACSFECKVCNNEYTVLCRMMDQAECFQCHSVNNPLHWAAPRELEHKTNNPHSCSRCMPNGECPNIQEAKFARQ